MYATAIAVLFCSTVVQYNNNKVDLTYTHYGREVESRRQSHTNQNKRGGKVFNTFVYDGSLLINRRTVGGGRSLTERLIINKPVGLQ